MFRRALMCGQRVIPTRSLLRKRGGLPALSATPGLTQGIGKAEALQQKLYEAEYKEAHAEDFHNPRSEETATQEILDEFRRMRAYNQEIAKRVDATPEYQKFDEELSLEINALEATFYVRVKDGYTVTAEAQLAMQENREKICEYYRAKHAPVLSPIVNRIYREVEEEIASGKLVIGEVDNEFLNHLYDRRLQQESDPRIIEAVHERIVLKGDEDESPQALTISDKWSEEELEEQREMAFVPTKKRDDGW